jgi:hypothetical protein
MVYLTNPDKSLLFSKTEPLKPVLREILAINPEIRILGSPRNVAYYIIAHASNFSPLVRSGSKATHLISFPTRHFIPPAAAL